MLLVIYNHVYWPQLTVLCRLGARGPRDSAAVPAGQPRRSQPRHQVHGAGAQEDLPGLQGRVSHGRRQRRHLQRHLFTILPEGRWELFLRSDALSFNIIKIWGHWTSNMVGLVIHAYYLSNFKSKSWNDHVNISGFL